MYSLLNMVIFHCYVSLPEGNHSFQPRGAILGSIRWQGPKGLWQKINDGEFQLRKEMLKFCYPPDQILKKRRQPAIQGSKWFEVVWWVATGWYQRRKRRCKSDVSWFILRMWEHNRFSTNKSKLHKYLTQGLNPNETSANHKHCGRLIIQGLDVVVPYQTSRGRMLHHPEGFKR